MKEGKIHSQKEKSKQEIKLSKQDKNFLNKIEKTLKKDFFTTSFGRVMLEEWVEKVAGNDLTVIFDKDVTKIQNKESVLIVPIHLDLEHMRELASIFSTDLEESETIYHDFFSEMYHGGKHLQEFLDRGSPSVDRLFFSKIAEIFQDVSQEFDENIEDYQDPFEDKEGNLKREKMLWWILGPNSYLEFERSEASQFINTAFEKLYSDGQLNLSDKEIKELSAINKERIVQDLIEKVDVSKIQSKIQKESEEVLIRLFPAIAKRFSDKLLRNLEKYQKTPEMNLKKQILESGKMFIEDFKVPEKAFYYNLKKYEDLEENLFNALNIDELEQELTEKETLYHEKKIRPAEYKNVQINVITTVMNILARFKHENDARYPDQISKELKANCVAKTYMASHILHELGFQVYFSSIADPLHVFVTVELEDGSLVQLDANFTDSNDEAYIMTFQRKDIVSKSKGNIDQLRDGEIESLSIHIDDENVEYPEVILGDFSKLGFADYINSFIIDYVHEYDEDIALELYEQIIRSEGAINNLPVLMNYTFYKVDDESQSIRRNIYKRIYDQLDKATGIQLLLELEDDIDKKELLIREWLDLEPNKALPYIELSDIFYSKDDLDQALKILKKYQELEQEEGVDHKDISRYQLSAEILYVYIDKFLKLDDRDGNFSVNKEEIINFLRDYQGPVDFRIVNSLDDLFDLLVQDTQRPKIRDEKYKKELEKKWMERCKDGVLDLLEQESYGFVSTINEERWNMFFERYLDFIAEHSEGVEDIVEMSVTELMETVWAYALMGELDKAQHFLREYRIAKGETAEIIIKTILNDPEFESVRFDPLKKWVVQELF